MGAEFFLQGMDVLLTSSGELFLISLLRKAAVIFDVKETLQKSLHRCPELGTSALKWSASARLSSLAQYSWLPALFLLVRSISVFQAVTLVTASVAVSPCSFFCKA